MNKEQKQALSKLLNLYTELYPCKDIFKSKLFPYTPDELSCIFAFDVPTEKNLCEKHSNSIREDVKALQTVEQVKDYILSLELLDGKYETLAENKLASELTIADYKYIYSILYTSPVSSKIKKETLIGYIVKYFKGIERAQALKP